VWTWTPFEWLHVNGRGPDALAERTNRQGSTFDSPETVDKTRAAVETAALCLVSRPQGGEAVDARAYPP